MNKQAETSRLTLALTGEIKKRQLQERRFKENLKNIVIYCCFVWIILFIAFTKVDNRSYRYKSNLENLFRVTDDVEELSFGQVKPIFFTPNLKFFSNLCH